MFDLSGRVAIVTGGSRGLGLGIAGALGEMGAKVFLVARGAEDLDAAVGSLVAEGVDACGVAVDLLAANAFSTIAENVLARWGRVDVLVNNAALSWVEPAEEHSLESWRKVMALNVESVFLLTREIGRVSMIPRRSGRVINVASIGGLGGNRLRYNARTLAYNTSKGAIVNFTRALAVEWGAHQITVNAICPGFFRSRMSSTLLRRIEADVVADTPLGRVGNIDDMKGLAVLLASDGGRFITGQAIAVDGGFTAG